MDVEGLDGIGARRRRDHRRVSHDDSSCNDQRRSQTDEGRANACDTIHVLFSSAYGIRDATVNPSDEGIADTFVSACEPTPTSNRHSWIARAESLLEC